MKITEEKRFGHRQDIAAQMPRDEKKLHECKQCGLLDVCGNIFLLGLIVLVSYMLDLLRDKTVLVLAERWFPQSVKDDIETAVEDTDEILN